MDQQKQMLWQRWGPVFAERTERLPAGQEFTVADVFPDEWGREIVGGDRNALGGAIQHAIGDPVQYPQLNHITALGVPGPPYHHRYRRNDD